MSDEKPEELETPEPGKETTDKSNTLGGATVSLLQALAAWVTGMLPLLWAAMAGMYYQSHEKNMALFCCGTAVFAQAGRMYSEQARRKQLRTEMALAEARYHAEVRNHVISIAASMFAQVTQVTGIKFAATDLADAPDNGWKN